MKIFLLKISKKNLFISLEHTFSWLSWLKLSLIVLLRLKIFVTGKKLQLCITFPLEYERNVVIYWISYLCVAWGVFIFGTCNKIVIIIWYILLNYSVKFHILGNNLRKLGAMEMCQNYDKRKRSEFHHDLVVSARKHQDLCEYDFLIFLYVTLKSLCS